VRKAASIDEETLSEVWEFENPNGDRALKPGSYAYVRPGFYMRDRTELFGDLVDGDTLVARAISIRNNLNYFA
jgi:hypothetical protein